MNGEVNTAEKISIVVRPEYAGQSDDEYTQHSFIDLQADIPRITGSLIGWTEYYRDGYGSWEEFLESEYGEAIEAGAELTIKPYAELEAEWEEEARNEAPTAAAAG